MSRRHISFGMAAAGLCAAAMSVSCVHQVQPLSGIPPVSANTTDRESKRQMAAHQMTAMERQIQNATDAGEGDATVRALRQRLAAEPDNLAVRLELIDHYTRGGYPEL